eukprot:INCI15064.5.p1 GENE.INCI15064.5~~INCI15064.5.p1  ORF type:complete len:121 (+),score=14.13 INCI15064.5:214-576(+)
MPKSNLSNSIKQHLSNSIKQHEPPEGGTDVDEHDGSETESLLQSHRHSGGTAAASLDSPAPAVARETSGRQKEHAAQKLSFDFSAPSNNDAGGDEDAEKIMKVCNQLSCGLCSQACLSCW